MATLTTAVAVVDVGLATAADRGLVSFSAFEAEAILRILVILRVGGWVALLAVFLMWVHRTVLLARPFGVAQAPGWAVGSWFIPFGNLFLPYPPLKAAWDAHPPGASVKPGLLANLHRAEWLPPVWWVTWSLYLGAIYAVQIATQSWEASQVAAHGPDFDPGQPPWALMAHQAVLALHVLALPPFVAFLRAMDRREREHLQAAA